MINKRLPGGEGIHNGAISRFVKRAIGMAMVNLTVKGLAPEFFKGVAC